MFSRSRTKNLSILNHVNRNLSHSRGVAGITHNCRLLIAGGGSGGCTLAAKFTHCNKFKTGDIIVVDPADYHYYQPMFTLIGGGVKTLQQSARPMGSVLPKSVKWFKNSVVNFEPNDNLIQLCNGDKIKYDFLLVAIGLQLNYHEIPGLMEALSIPDGNVCSNYSPYYVERTFKAFQNFKQGNAIFTYPNTPVKCPGAPQKIMYIAEHYLRKNNKRNTAEIIYNTSLPVIFGVKKYADALWKVCHQRNIKVNLRTNLIKIIPEKNTAIFENLDTHEQFSYEYELMHVPPPMSAPDCLKNNQDLTNGTGFLDVHKESLQHKKYKNIFGIGDCTNTPNSKTAASVAAQSGVVYQNLQCIMEERPPGKTYDGYASCPLITGYDSCILAEFDYNLTPKETFPISQDKEMYLMYMLKKDLMPVLYWHAMLNGYWNGPSAFRKFMHPFSKC